MSFYLGCAVWAYRGWLGHFYPAGSHSKDFLRLYSQRLTAVEGNTTFYSIPSLEMVARWAQETPGEFKFCPKLPKRFTHQGRLQPAIAESLKFITLMQGLNVDPQKSQSPSPPSQRLGTFFAQLPPSYGPEQLDDLAAFLQTWPTETVRLAIEVRHPAWFQEPHRDRLNTLLQNHQIGRVLLDTRPIYAGEDDPQVASERRKPQLPLEIITTAPFTLVRYIAHPDLARNTNYFQTWIQTLQSWKDQAIEVYFFVHCPIEARSPDLAHHFYQLLVQQGIPVPPLPWDQIIPEESTVPAVIGDQLNLF